MTAANIIQYLKAKWKILASAFTIVVAVGTGLVTLKDAKDIVWPWFSAEENMSVLQARLQPFRVRPDIKEGQDEVFLMMEVRNYDTSPLLMLMVVALSLLLKARLDGGHAVPSAQMLIRTNL